MKRLGALEALGRGIANVRGNFELVGVVSAGTIALLGVVLLSMIPWLGLGEAELASLFRVAAGQAQATDLPALAAQSWAIVSDLWGFLLALSVGLTVASVVYSWYFGGVLGVLFAGDAQAPPGPGRAADLFRTWAPRFFAGEATRLVWRVLGFYSLWLALVTVVIGVLAGGIALAAGFGAAFGGVAAVALGCGAALPLFFLFFAALGAMSLGQVELVPASGGVLAASKAGWRLLGRRLLAVMTLFLLLFVAAFALGIFEAGVGWAVTSALAERPAAQLTAQGALFIAQVMLSSLLNLVFAGAFVALVRSERRIETSPAA